MCSFLKNRDGATAIEYGLICAVLVLAMVIGLATLGNSVQNSYNDTGEKVKDAMQH